MTNQKHYPDLVSDVISMEFRWSFLSLHFVGKPVVMLWNDGGFSGFSCMALQDKKENIYKINDIVA